MNAERLAKLNELSEKLKSHAGALAQLKLKFRPEGTTRGATPFSVSVDSVALIPGRPGVKEIARETESPVFSRHMLTVDISGHRSERIVVAVPQPLAERFVEELMRYYETESASLSGEYDRA